MGFADLYIHSMYSYDGTASISAILKYVAEYTDLNVIAITDHDSMEGVP
jgi:predicted metal-dependent phosphoesterase TrpH